MKCFVIMPFANVFDDVYQAIRASTAVHGEEVNCIRLDEIRSAGRITDDLLRELDQSSICIADLTCNRANVMWEVGYAMALKKPILFLAQDTKDIPFDIKDMRTILYDRNSLAKTLTIPLSESFRATLGAYEISRNTVRLPLPPKGPFAIAVTGSMDADPEKCARRIESVAKHYLSDETTWYCGSYGVVDEVAIQYLLAHEQKIVVVGYHAFDISDKIFDLVTKHKIPFVDAKKENLPTGFKAPSERDLIYLIRSDLLVALWNGTSAGTEELIDWYRQHQKDCLITFV